MQKDENSPPVEDLLLLLAFIATIAATFATCAWQIFYSGRWTGL
jgi:hypothetical protein